MRIVLVGGGTGGSVTPLLAVAEKIKKEKPETEFLFIGTSQGKPEQEMIKGYYFQFKKIFSGKWRRYFSWQNFFDPFLIFLGFIQSLFILRKFRPRIIVSAGGFVAVPLVLAGWLLKIPSLIHQQDLVPSLTNKILSPFVKKITVSFEESLNDFPKNKTIFTGNPVREIIKNGDKERAVRRFNLEENLPTLFVLGGGTGAQKINELIWEILPRLTRFCQIIHLTGKGKLKIENCPLRSREGEASKLSRRFIGICKKGSRDPDLTLGKIENFRYYSYEFFTDEIADAYAVADLVISRAGLNVLTELAVLGKASIIIPIPDSHQEVNANYFAEKNAALVLDQKNLQPEKLLKIIQEVINDQKQRKKLSENIKKIFPLSSGDKITKEILKLC